jgi:thioredoxin family protein
MPPTITPERFAQGMTFDEYVAHIGTPENLARESTTVAQAGGRVEGLPRRDYSHFFAEAFRNTRLNEYQIEALTRIASMRGGPAKMLVISEDWSSDCRRDVPTFARIAAVTGMELRIFQRDGQKFSAAHIPSPAESPNANIMAEFLNHKNGETWQSIPVAAFFTRDLEYLYHYTEYPAIYEKDRLRGQMVVPRPGETPDQTRDRAAREFQELQDSAYFRIWASAAVDEIVSALHRRMVLGSV